MLTLRNRLRNNDLNIGILALWQFVLRNLVMFSLTLDAWHVSLLNGCRTESLSAGCLYCHGQKQVVSLCTMSSSTCDSHGLRPCPFNDVLGSMCEVVTVLRIARQIQLFHLL